MDANEQIAKEKIEGFLHKLGLRKGILHCYHFQTLVATRVPGSEMIDGIWVSRGINIKRGGYTPFKETSAFDHREAWVDVGIDESSWA